MLVKLLSALCISLCHSACVDLTAKGYYHDTKVFTAGLPPDSNGRTYVTKPSQLDYCELEELSQYCVDRINLYRAGTLVFNDNTTDPGIPRPALQYAKAYASCSSSQAFGDLWGSTGSCNNAHKNAFSCPDSAVGQNACCYRTGMTLAQIKSILNGCLQQMWDEGKGLPVDAPFTTNNGHWYSMRSTSNKLVSCGFAYSSNGGLWMNQDFFSSGPASVSACSCSAAGTSDGCGGICVNADGSKFGTGIATTGPYSIAALVLSLLAVVVFVALLFVFVRKEKTTPVDGLGSKAEYINLALQFMVFVLGCVAIGSPLWAQSDSGVTLSLWSVCVPSPSGESCDAATTASSGSGDVLKAVQAFAVIGMILALFAFVGFALVKALKLGPKFSKGFFGMVVLDSVFFFLAICFFGGYFLDVGDSLTVQWGCGIEILCWILSAVSIPFARVPTVKV